MFNDIKECCNYSSCISVNLNHIQHNFCNVVKKIVSPGKKIIAMVKSNAYGHGIIEVSRALEKVNIDYLGVFSVEEARLLKKAQISSPVIIFGVPNLHDFHPFDLNQTALIVSSQDELSNMMQWTETNQQALAVHIKVDTGMGRLGFFPEKALETIISIKNHYPLIKIEGICTHFAESSNADRTFTLLQGKRFNQLLESLEQHAVDIPLVHAANSGAILHFPEFHYTAVRPGILLYGVSPDETRVSGLKPALSFYSYIGDIKTLPSGSYVSYGRTYQTQRTTRIAIIPLGYADGIPLTLSNHGHVILQDKKCPIIGSVCMNQFMIDITDLDATHIGEQVIIIGKGTSNSITVAELAQLAHTLPYDIICRLSLFQSRQYLG